MLKLSSKLMSGQLCALHTVEALGMLLGTIILPSSSQFPP